MVMGDMMEGLGATGYSGYSATLSIFAACALGHSCKIPWWLLSLLHTSGGGPGLN